MVPIVFNPNGIEPNFLKLDLWSPGTGFIPIIISSILNYIKEKRIQEKKTVLWLAKHLSQFLKWVQSCFGFNSTPTFLNTTIPFEFVF